MARFNDPIEPMDLANTIVADMSKRPRSPAGEPTTLGNMRNQQ
jgi:hypothetical protein